VAVIAGHSIDLLREGGGIVNLDAEIPHGILDPGMTEQWLDGSQSDDHSSLNHWTFDQLLLRRAVTQFSQPY
jgi:hypothetical protein